MGQFQHLDAAESAFAQRELEYIEKQAYSVRYPGLKMAQLIPINTSQPSWTEVGVYFMMDMYGAAKVIDNYGQNLPRAAVSKAEYTWKAKRYGISYGYTLDEMKKSAALGMSLDASEATAARRGYDETMDSVGFSGDSTLGLVGLNGLSNTTSYTVPNGAAGTATWITKTPDEIVADMHGICDNIIATTKGVGMPDRLLLPIEQYQLAARLRMGDGSDTTVLQHFLAVRRLQTPGFQVESYYKLDAAGSGSADRMIAYRYSNEVLEWFIPEMFNQLPVEQRNMEFIVNCTGKIGSVVCRYPFEVSYGDGI